MSYSKIVLQLNLLVFFFILSTSISFAQEEEKESKNSSIDVSYGMKLLYPQQDDLFSFVSKVSRSSHFGIAYSKAISYKLDLKSGIAFFSSEFEFESSSYRFTDEINTGTNSNPDRQLYSNRYLKFTFIEVPLALRYYLNDKKIRSYIESGINIRYISVAKLTDVPISQNEYSKINYLANIAIGFEKSINHHFNIYLQSSYQHTFHGNYYKPSLKRVLDFGLEIGLRIKI